MFWQIYKFENPIKRLKLPMDPPPETEAREACFYERIVTIKDWKDTDSLLDLAGLFWSFPFQYEHHLSG